jgi:hypothetical protein
MEQNEELRQKCNKEKPMKKLDGKFSGVIIKSSDGSIVPEDQYMVFLAKDNALPATLEFYEEECERIGAQPEQIEAVRKLRARLQVWRQLNPELCKVPDVKPGQLLI